MDCKSIVLFTNKISFEKANNKPQKQNYNPQNQISTFQFLISELFNA